MLFEVRGERKNLNESDDSKLGTSLLCGELNPQIVEPICGINNKRESINGSNFRGDWTPKFAQKYYFRLVPTFWTKL